MSTGWASSAWRRAKASRRWVSAAAALGALHGAVDQPFDRRIVRQPLAQQLEIAVIGGQQVVEVVRHAAGQLADRFQLLRLSWQLGDRAPHAQRSSLAHPALERRASRAALAAPRRRGARLVLAPAAAQGRCATLTSVVGWNGRSRKVTLPSSSSSRAAPVALRARRRGWSAGRRASPTRPAGRQPAPTSGPQVGVAAAPPRSTIAKPAPASSASTQRRQVAADVGARCPASRSSAAATRASRPRGARISARSDSDRPAVAHAGRRRAAPCRRRQARDAAQHALEVDRAARRR